jgi:hypothetical protein
MHAATPLGRCARICCILHKWYKRVTVTRVRGSDTFSTAFGTNNNLYARSLFPSNHPRRPMANIVTLTNQYTYIHTYILLE